MCACVHVFCTNVKFIHSREFRKVTLCQRSKGFCGFGTFHNDHINPAALSLSVKTN